jgi:hypothetical protein
MTSLATPFLVEYDLKKISGHDFLKDNMTVWEVHCMLYNSRPLLLNKT